MNGRPGHIRSRRAKKVAITPIVVLHPSVTATHVLPALHVQAAGGFPDDYGVLLATENLQPVTRNPVECALAAHPAAVLISFAWLRKVPHGVVAVAVQRKQEGA